MWLRQQWNDDAGALWAGWHTTGVRGVAAEALARHAIAWSQRGGGTEGPSVGGERRKVEGRGAPRHLETNQIRVNTGKERMIFSHLQITSNAIGFANKYGDSGKALLG